MEIMLSVIMTVYNHEAYIKKAIDSLLMQKIDFTYEVLIGEDCSTDGSRQIISQMEETLPECVHIYYREKNLGMYGNFTDLCSQAKGRYMIILEGDDYWMYECKLQWQVDYLNQHPEILAVAHNTIVVDENNNPIDGAVYPDCHDRIYTLKHYRKGIMPGHTATLMYRNYHRDSIFSTEVEHVPFAGDQLIAFLLASNGQVHCIQQRWSAYRHVLKSGSSYSATFRDDDDYKKRMVYFYRSLYRYASGQFANGLSIRVSAQLYCFYLFRWSLGKKALFSMKDFIKEFKMVRYKGAVLVYILYRIAAHLFLGKRRGWSNSH